MRRRTHEVALGVGAAILSCVVAACGSQIDPSTVAGATGTTSDVVANVDGTPQSSLAPGSVPTGGTDLGGPDPGSGPITDPGPDSAPTGSAGPGAPSSGAGDDAAPSGGKAASCEGFHNQTGITDSTITIANASDISGPVPGLFESAQQATRAYAAYFNASSDLCGRKLEVLALDTRADAGADQQAYAKACESAFAAVGSMSAFDSGGASNAQGCGLPDLRSTSVTPERTRCGTCFSAQSVAVNLVPSVIPKYFLDKYHEATQHVALLYINSGAAPVNATSFRSAWLKDGWKIPVFEGIDVSEFNYAPYVQQMKDKGVQMVIYVGPYQNTVKLQQAQQQQNFEPQVFLQDATIYDQHYVDQAGSLGDGTFVYSSTALFDDSSNPEMVLYRQWLNQVAPGAIPNYYGLYAWSAARLFVEQAEALGGRLTRASMVAALKKVKDWTGNGLHVPQQVGPKTTYDCAAIIQLNSGRWKQVSPGTYMCGPLTDSGVGG